jgi:PAS domain S-box-containing protein
MVKVLLKIESFKSLPTPFILLLTVFCGHTLFFIGFIQQESPERFYVYFLGGLEIALFSALVSSFVAYHVFIRKINEIGRVLEQAEAGNFQARVEEKDTASSVGSCIRQVNRLVSTIDEYIGKLHELNSVGEELASALTRDEVVRIVVETVENQLDGKCVGIFDWKVFKSSSDQSEPFVEQLGKQDLSLLAEGAIVTVPEIKATRHEVYGKQPCRFLYVPVVEQNVTSSVIVFSGKKGGFYFTATVNEFAGTLSRLISNAIARIQSIHELTRAESTYRALFMTIQGGIFRVSNTGKFDAINPAFAQMTGYGSMEEMLGNVGNLSTLFVEKSEHDRFMSTLEQEGRLKSTGFELLRRDGTL